MSQQMVSRVLEHSQARGPAFALLLVLAHDEYGKGWVVTQDALAARARISRPTVQRALIDLQVGGELEVTPRGKKRPNHHQVILECPLECPDHLKHCYVPKHQSDATEQIGCIREEHRKHQSDARSSSNSSSSSQKKRGARPPLEVVRAQPEDPALSPAEVEEITIQEWRRRNGFESDDLGVVASMF